MVTRTKDTVTPNVQEEITVRPRARMEARPGVGGLMRAEMTIDDVKALIEDKVKAAYDQFLSTPREEIAEPLEWWDLYGLGPWQPGASMTPPAGFSGPLLPNQVIRAGEVAYVATILVLNQFFPTSGPSAAEILSSFALPYRIDYGTGELKKWQPAPAYLQHTSQGNLVPHVPYAVDVWGFTCQDEGLFEMNITARIYGCDENLAPPFAGFATTIIDLDKDMFGNPARVEQDIPIRFQCYK